MRNLVPVLRPVLRGVAGLSVVVFVSAAVPWLVLPGAADWGLMGFGVLIGGSAGSALFCLLLLALPTAGWRQRSPHAGGASAMAPPDGER